MCQRLPHAIRCKQYLLCPGMPPIQPIAVGPDPSINRYASSVPVRPACGRQRPSPLYTQLLNSTSYDATARDQPSSTGASKSLRIGISVGVGLLAMVVLMLAVLLGWVWWRRRCAERQKLLKKEVEMEIRRRDSLRDGIARKGEGKPGFPGQ